MNRSITIHGHFYQPPRENPWLEAIEQQGSAHPYHDWNARISAECYAPNAAPRILDATGRIVEIGNNYSKMSFNFGPTLLSWMEVNDPDTYRSIIETDRKARRRFSGHGPALAQVYNHMIMPLANARDKETQVVWGIRDFRTRFGRAPEGMWLPETAVNYETLEVLAAHGILFTILAPRQARAVRPIGDAVTGEWLDVSDGSIDPKVPYLCRLPSGQTISLFFYDGPISQDIAFGHLLDRGENVAERLTGAFNASVTERQLVHIATDGETYGHHHTFGEMALAYCLYHLRAHKLATVTIYGEYLEKFPPAREVTIIEDTSWSCIHGIERWRSNCGCNSGHPVWTQEWRAPLREALDWLREALAAVFDEEARLLLRNPWEARNAYIDVILDRSEESVEQFFSTYAAGGLTLQEKVTALKLLEMQRHAMLMYTSCGWFFDEISGIETVQVIQYAARALQLAAQVSGVSLEGEFVGRLANARSNLPEIGNGAMAWERHVKPAVVDIFRIGAHYAISSLFEEYPESFALYAHQIDAERFQRAEAGRQRLAIGKVHIRSTITWEERTLTFVAAHLGGMSVHGGVREFQSDEAFARMAEEITRAFQTNDFAQIIHGMDEHFGTHTYSLSSLFADERRKITAQILESTIEDIERSYRLVYENHYPAMLGLKELGGDLPDIFVTTAGFIMSKDLLRLIEAVELDVERLARIVEEITRWPFTIDAPTVGFAATRRVNMLMERLRTVPDDLATLKTVTSLLGLLGTLPLGLNLWKAQNIHFTLSNKAYPRFYERAHRDGETDEIARAWIETFKQLEEHLYIRR